MGSITQEKHKLKGVKSAKTTPEIPTETWSKHRIAPLLSHISGSNFSRARKGPKGNDECGMMKSSPGGQGNRSRIAFSASLREQHFLIPHSSFLIPHSSFLIPHSSFLIPNS
jgi:hypothetical protein